MTKPILAVTLGDPAGVGPKIIVKAAQHPGFYAACRPLVIGDQRMIHRAFDWLVHAGHLADLNAAPAVEVVESPAEGRYLPGTITLLDLANADPAEIPVGQVNPLAGKAAVDYVFRACDLAVASDVAAVVTAPLNKEAIFSAGFSYPGHTELLTERTKAERVSMLLVGPKLRVVHVSTHVALEEAIRCVTRARQRSNRHRAAILFGPWHQKSPHRHCWAKPPRQRK